MALLAWSLAAATDTFSPGPCAIDPVRVYGEHIGIDLERTGSADNPLVQSLEAMKARYETIVEKGGWPRIDADFYLLEPSAESRAVPLLKKRLAVTGDYNGSLDANTTYGPDLVEAVRHFQARHGLKTDGIVGPNTLRWLNVTAERKLALVEANLMRLAWLTTDARDFVAVNVPDFTLALYRDGEPRLRMRVVVGSKARPTPMMADTITYAVLNPTWRAPETIVERDIYPKLLADRYDELRASGIVALQGGDANESVPLESVDWSRYRPDDVPYVFMQEPGPKNFLGLVKFMFPNDHDIYLHDTPHTEHFSKRVRAYSSGCIRLEKPIELFHALFDPHERGEWGYRKIVRTLLEKKSRLVGLKYPLPVYILYMTAFVDAEGRDAFRDDIYGYDAILAKYLNEVEHGPDSRSASVK
ncbi:L,D-transpeptidase family protein [Hydrogenimonas sp.]